MHSFSSHHCHNKCKEEIKSSAFFIANGMERCYRAEWGRFLEWVVTHLCIVPAHATPEQSQLSQRLH